MSWVHKVLLNEIFYHCSKVFPADYISVDSDEYYSLCVLHEVGKDAKNISYSRKY